MRLFAILCFAALPVFAGGDASHPVFTGTWQLDPASSQIHSHLSGAVVWTIDQKDEDIHLNETGTERGATFEVTCGTHGADCKTKEAGKPVTLSFWYNGPALVEMETAGKGEEVTKKKMQLSDDGSAIIVEVTHILPEGRGPEKYVFKKQH